MHNMYNFDIHLLATDSMGPQAIHPPPPLHFEREGDFTYVPKGGGAY